MCIDLGGHLRNGRQLKCVLLENGKKYICELFQTDGVVVQMRDWDAVMRKLEDLISNVSVPIFGTSG